MRLVSYIQRASGCTERLPADGNFSLGRGDRVVTKMTDARMCSKCFQTMAIKTT